MQNLAFQTYLQGDSGGPVVCEGKNKITGIIVGTGCDVRCDDKYNPHIFTNIWFYKDWIREKMK